MTFRYIAAVVFLMLALLAAAVFLVSTSMVEPSAIPGLGPALLAIFKLDPIIEMPRRVFAASVSTLVGLTCVYVLMRSFGGQTKPTKLTMQKTAQGVVYVDPDGIGAVISEPILQVPGVVAVKTKTGDRTPVKLDLMVSVSPAVDLQKLGDEVRRRAIDALSRQLGIDVKLVRLDFEVIELHQLRSRMLD